VNSFGSSISSSMRRSTETASDQIASTADRSARLSQAAEHGLSAAAIRRAGALAAERGVTFSLSDDFDELLAVNRSNLAGWDPLMPQFHPDYFDARRSSAFWIRGVDRSGRIIAARGYRRYDLPQGKTLHDSLVDLSLFYDDPAKARQEERLESSALMPHRVSGSFAFSGALWIHPDARRLGLSSLMWPIGRAIALDLWDIPLLFALVEDATKMRSVLGFDDMEGGIRWSGSYVGPEFRFTIVWWSRDRIVQDVNGFLEKT
jgi:hypothetical protein